MEGVVFGEDFFHMHQKKLIEVEFFNLILINSALFSMMAVSYTRICRVRDCPGLGNARSSVILGALWKSASFIMLKNRSDF